MRLRPSEIEELTELVISEISKKFYLVEKKPSRTRELPNDFSIVESVISFVCQVRCVDPSEIRSKNRSQENCVARQMVYYIVRRHFPFISLYTMAKVLNRDHSTAVYGIKTLTNRISVDKLYKRKVEEMCEKFKVLHETALNKISV